MCTVQFVFVWFGKVQIQGLTLVDVCPAVSSHLNDCLLRYLPNCLVQLLYVIRDAFNSLHAKHNKWLQ